MTLIGALDAIAELHSPILPPEGCEYMGSDGDKPRCIGCMTGNPYMDEPWPCATAEIIQQIYPGYVWPEKRVER